MKEGSMISMELIDNLRMSDNSWKKLLEEQVVEICVIAQLIILAG
jgi:hypothetical protein